jgi:hypothetical protein
MDRLVVEAGGSAANLERPEWVTWNGQRSRVAEIEGQWHEPDRTLFRVRLAGGERLLLSRREADQSWAAMPVEPRFRSYTA